MHNAFVTSREYNIRQKMPDPFPWAPSPLLGLGQCEVRSDSSACGGNLYYDDYVIKYAPDSCNNAFPRLRMDYSPQCED
eukprot:8441870-Pyramimonas_sp.AAC.1